MMLSLGNRSAVDSVRRGRGVQVREGIHPSAPCLPARYLNNDGLSWLLAVEEPFHIKLWGHRVLLHWRANLLPFALDDHIRVGS